MFINPTRDSAATEPSSGFKVTFTSTFTNPFGITTYTPQRMSIDRSVQVMGWETPYRLFKWILKGSDDAIWHHLKTEGEPSSESRGFIFLYFIRTMHKVQNTIILNVIHHRQKLLELRTSYITFFGCINCSFFENNWKQCVWTSTWFLSYIYIESCMTSCYNVHALLHCFL
jgi:hypothetical protein